MGKPATLSVVEHATHVAAVGNAANLAAGIGFWHVAHSLPCIAIVRALSWLSILAKRLKALLWCAFWLRGVKIRVQGLHVAGMALYPFILLAGPADAQTLRHERIHLAQQLELLVLPFYVLYLGQYLWLRLGKGLAHHAAYRGIVFEREAYNYEATQGYLRRRKLWAWARTGAGSMLG